MYLEDVEKRVLDWAAARNILAQTTLSAQYLKLKEEFEELGKAIEKPPIIKDDTVDAIGDMMVVLTLMAALLKLDLFTCYAKAYLEIKHRTGKIVDGIFVKD